jgi:hypothetical protein
MEPDEYAILLRPFEMSQLFHKIELITGSLQKASGKIKVHNCSVIQI